jgi:LPPG:FO 2-phospho-L-lactate transferase
MIARAGAAGKVVALCGGIGGAKLALGLARVLPPAALTVIVNTGDDFEHLGLHVSPDIDTVVYTLAGVNDPVRGWGRADETWNFMHALSAIGGEDWFQLGDRDLATHIERTRRLREGQSLSQVTAALASAFGIEANIVPMSDAPVRTVLETEDGALPFQRYFVQRRCEPKVKAIRFEGANHALPAPGVADALRDPNLRCIVVCPSNPYLSVDPILAVAGISKGLRDRNAPTVAVSPIIGGRAVKGPTAKIMAELGLAPDNKAIAAHYEDLIDGLVVEASDSDTQGVACETFATSTLMQTLDDRMRLASETLAFADRLRTHAPRQHEVALQ